VAAARLPRLEVWMTGAHQESEANAIDEGAWIYLIAPANGSSAEDSLRERIVQACEAGGWSAISWPQAGVYRPPDPGHLFEGVRHAVEHADCVVVLLGGSAETTDAELALAYSHRRPIIGVRSSDGSSSDSGVQAMLGDYERARMITCGDADECAGELRAIFRDPEFAATIRRAAGEHAMVG
jgi:hypothetical protein